MVWTAPAECGNGHRLVYPNVLRSWTPCQCARAVRPSKGPAGHDYVYCHTCGEEIREGGCDRLVNGRRVRG